MALKQVEINEQITRNNQRITEIETELENFTKRSFLMRNEFKEASENDDVEKLTNIIEETDEIEDRSKELITEKEKRMAQNEKLNEQLVKLEKGEQAKMEIKEKAPDLMEHREAINDYFRTKDITRAEGFTSTDGQVIIPTEIIYQPRDEVYTRQNLLNYINRVSVNTASGTYPILMKQDAVMHTVEELAENPELAKPKFLNIRFDVETYRGQLEISQEAIDDSAVDLLGIVVRDIAQQQINTTNGLVLSQLREFKNQEVSFFDDIKDILNVELDPEYDVIFILSQTLFNYIDKMKDADGNYLVQPDVTDRTVRRLLGHEVVVVRDELIGKKKGDPVGFVGDARAGVTFFDRKLITARWSDHPTYGEMLMTGFRGQVKLVDYNAGYYIRAKEVADTEQLSADRRGQIIISKE